MNNATMTFHQRLQQNQVVLAPGIYDALSALIAEQSGFEALYLSGASIAYTRLGRSDVGLTTATEVADTLARIGKVTPREWLAPIEGPIWGYRRRARLGAAHRLRHAGRGRRHPGLGTPGRRHRAGAAGADCSQSHRRTG